MLIEMYNITIFGIDYHDNINEWNDKIVDITDFSREEAMDETISNTCRIAAMCGPSIPNWNMTVERRNDARHSRNWL